MSLTAALLFALAAASSPTAAPDADMEVYAHPQRLVELPDGRRLNLHCTGQGGPTVVFDGGWTSTTASWRRVQSRVAEFTRACSYDRAGYGFSDPGPLPRTAGAAADDLASMLHASGERGPYVIVAHSLGGMDARLFVDRHRRDVAGLVMVDPASPHQSSRLAALSPQAGEAETSFNTEFETCAKAVIAAPGGVVGRDACIDPPARSLPASVNAARRANQSSASYQTAALSELSSMEEASSAEVEKSRRSWGGLPVVVLTAERTQQAPGLSPEDQTILSRAWWSMHQDVADLARGSRHRLVPGVGHNVPSQAPEAVVGAVREVVTAMRSPKR